MVKFTGSAFWSYLKTALRTSPKPVAEVHAMAKLALFPLAAGIICLSAATILIARIEGPLDVQILDHYFVLSPKWLFLVGAALVVPSLALVAAH
jgi:hypothetical protein